MESSVIMQDHAASYAELGGCVDHSFINKHSVVEAKGDGELYKQASSHCNSTSNTDTNTYSFHALNNDHQFEFKFNPNPNPNPILCYSTSTTDSTTYLSPPHHHHINHLHRQNNCDSAIPSSHSNPSPCPRSSADGTEDQGECNGDNMNCDPVDTFNTAMVSCRRPSAAAASCFLKDIEQEQEYFQQILGSSSYGWTDEKHSSYLDSMEADFLRSVMFKGSVFTEPSDLEDSASSHQVQFKVCQNGRWRPKCVQAPNYLGPLKQLAVAVKNPWIKRFRPSIKTSFPSLVMEDPLVQEARTHFNSQHGGQGQCN